VTDLAAVTTGQTTAGANFAPNNGVAAAGTAGVAANAVTINDSVASGAATAATIASISAKNYTTLSITDNALTSLSLAGGTGNVIIDNASTRTSKTTSLTLAVDGVKGGTLDDADVYTTLNVTASGADSTLANITTGAVTALSLAGTKALTLTSAAGLTALKTVTISGAAGLSADLSALAASGSVDASGTTGANTITVNSAVATYTGGSGADKVTTTAAGVSKAIDLGSGDDTLTLGSGTTTLTATVKGGAGTDTLSMLAADAATAQANVGFVNNLSGFEAITLTGAGSATAIDVSKFGPANSITSATTGNTTISFVAANATVSITGAQTGTLTVTGSDVTGTSDVLNLVQTNATGGTVAAAGYETINLTSSATGGTISITDAALKVLTIGGSKSTTVTLDAANVLATTIDASANTGGVTVTSVSTAAATITGGSGNDSLTAKAGTTAETLNGGAGNDTLTSNAGLTTLTGGAGFDSFIVGGAGASKNIYTTISDAQVGDTIQLAANRGVEVFGGKVVLGDTASFLDYCNEAAKGDGSVNGRIFWFQFGGNTYVVEDLSVNGTNTFVDGTDVVVKLTGLIDLSNSTLQGLAGNQLLIAPGG